ncbi:hypothetical protein LOK49_LG07G02879 [Camellia lanceoleosa]|uniref:Uncharacterized protein n=1 Tax=Camellia lanceoleosa TaxID=1840588 RepID=A0ACC0H2L8_9ERIC|nr:hypothetical protein LOK49_LG07G02879 [Camellia lanceoleosa]
MALMNLFSIHEICINFLSVTVTFVSSFDEDEDQSQYPKYSSYSVLIRCLTKLLNEGFFLFSAITFLLLRKLFPIVEPDPNPTKLRIAREGLESIERINNPIAAVFVCLRLISKHLLVSIYLPLDQFRKIFKI